MQNLDLPGTCGKPCDDGPALGIGCHLRGIALGSSTLEAEYDTRSRDGLALRVGSLDPDSFGPAPGLGVGRSGDGQGEKTGSQGQEAVVMHSIPLRLRQREANLFDHCSEQLTLREALGQAVVSGCVRTPPVRLP